MTRGIRDGDRVRATTIQREPGTVEGTLHLRVLAMYNTVGVSVERGGDLFDVDPASVELIDATGDADGLCLDDEIERGRTLPATERTDDSWDDLHGGLATFVRPLEDAGWTVVEVSQDESWEFGDSVSFSLERDGNRIEVERYDHGEVAAYSGGPTPDDADPAEALFAVAEASLDEVLREYETQGWIPSSGRPGT